MEPKLIEGNIFFDKRGEVAFVNDFDFSDIKRFYTVTNSMDNKIRAWQGHKLDAKNFYCVLGSFKIHYVKIDNWENPSPDLVVQTVILEATKSAVLHVPPGYANAIESLESNSKLLSFSTIELDQVSQDDVRFEPQTWKIYG
jgi:dTDP-4-dehydrorhamnose 3,5-epimerase-like enzyme